MNRKTHRTPVPVIASRLRRSWVRSRWRLCRLTDAAYPLRVQSVPRRYGTCIVLQEIPKSCHCPLHAGNLSLASMAYLPSYGWQPSLPCVKGGGKTTGFAGGIVAAVRRLKHFLKQYTTPQSRRRRASSPCTGEPLYRFTRKCPTSVRTDCHGLRRKPRNDRYGSAFF